VWEALLPTGNLPHLLVRSSIDNETFEFSDSFNLMLALLPVFSVLTNGLSESLEGKYSGIQRIRNTGLMAFSEDLCFRCCFHDELPFCVDTIL